MQAEPRTEKEKMLANYVPVFVMLQVGRDLLLFTMFCLFCSVALTRSSPTVGCHLHQQQTAQGRNSEAAAEAAEGRRRRRRDGGRMVGHCGRRVPQAL